MRNLLCILLLIITSDRCMAGNNGNNKYETTAKFVRAEVYYYGWDIVTRSRLPISAIRSSPRIRLSILEPYEVSRFVNWLELDRMTILNKASGGDPRLVIDLFDDEGRRMTYYASVFELFTEDSHMSRQIDKNFRERFHF